MTNLDKLREMAKPSDLDGLIADGTLHPLPGGWYSGEFHSLPHNVSARITEVESGPLFRFGPDLAPAAQALLDSIGLITPKEIGA